ncbi:ankyrin repeat-containing domain protein, partial [Tricharina praecox]|uniref:ankyrin repeat-containing domain protein n=1 Tax=Tricharina praecox TaxID=43433 RepID=UPI00221F9CFD
MNKEKTVWTFFMLLKLFRTIMRHINTPLCLIIDALDECEEPDRMILIPLQRLLQHSAIMPKLVLTSRPHIQVCSHMTSVAVIPLEAANLKCDITTVVATEVGKLNHLAGLANEIQETLVNGANVMFLWVSLILHDLRNSTSTTPRSIRQKLKSLPANIEEIYKNILRRINPDDRELAGTILRWVLWAMRPLTIGELAIAIAIRPGAESMASLEDDIQLHLETPLRSLFGPMFKVEADNTVHLVHHSANDFLLSDSAKKFFHSEFRSDSGEEVGSASRHLSSDEVNVELAADCLRYMSFSEFEDGPVPFDGTIICSRSELLFRSNVRRPEIALYDYATQQWAGHVRRSSKKARQKHHLARDFLNLAKYERRLNQAHSMRSLGDDTALHMTAKGGNKAIVQLLLDQGASVDAQDKYGWTALQFTVLNGKQGISQLFLDRGANIEAQTNNGWTALLIAVYYRKEATTIHLLLDRGANLEAQTNDGQTALRLAVQDGKEATIHLLLDRGANIEAQANDGRTVLYLAVGNGKQDIVELLLDRGANIEGKDKDGGTALKVAVLTGSLEIFRLLLDRGANIEVQDNDELTARLKVAASAGDVAISQLILDQPAHIRTQGTHALTALLPAAINENETIPQLPLD